MQISNYTVVVWLSVDLLLVLVSRNLSGLARTFNGRNEAARKRMGPADLTVIR